jgi:hypothetical protein
MRAPKLNFRIIRVPGTQVVFFPLIPAAFSDRIPGEPSHCFSREDLAQFQHRKQPFPGFRSVSVMSEKKFSNLDLEQLVREGFGVSDIARKLGVSKGNCN